jgi:hypothetical protein
MQNPKIKKEYIQKQHISMIIIIIINPTCMMPSDPPVSPQFMMKSEKKSPFRKPNGRWN